MTDLISYCKLHGILIDSPPPIGYWRRYPTDDHPNSRNGAVKYMGTHAFVQNWATGTEVAVWHADDLKPADVVRIQKQANDAEAQRQKQGKEAASKAAWILDQCQFGRHDYLKAKGFPEEQGNVWAFNGQQLLVIPMRSDGHLVGVQLIDEVGGKKFLSGQRTSGAEFVFNNKGMHVLVEGYATALSIRLALSQLKRRYTLHVCFSAGNMVKVAARLPAGVVIADNDTSGTGERVAKQIGWPYWMSDVEGEDANDTHRRLGLFKFSQSLTRSVVIL